MARRFTIELIMDLATRIGANPTKLAGTRTNISFLGKGPDKNPLFQSRLAGLENATKENLGKPEALFGAIEDAVGWAKDGKLNSIQTEILGHNLLGIKNVLHPPPLPTASVTNIAPGIEGLRRFPKETHKFFGRPLKTKDFSEIDRLTMEGKIPDARGRTWNFKTPGTGPGAYTAALNQKTGMSRAIARQILQQDTRLKLNPEELFMLREGKGEPLDLMRKYYGNSMMNLDAFLDDVIPRPGMNIKDIASRVLAEVELIPQFAEGGLAEILQAPRKGYWEGLTVKDFIGPVQEQKVISKGVDTSGWGKSRDDLIAESGFQNKNLLDFLSEKSRIGSNKYNLKLSPSAELNLSKFSSGDYNIKNKNIWMGLSSILNLGPFSADIDYSKIKDKIKVESREDAATVYKDAGDDEGLAYKLGYSKDGLNMDVRTNKDLNNFLFSLNKVFKKKPKILGKNYAKGGLARILEL